MSGTIRTPTRGTDDIRTIKGGEAALDAFLLTEMTRPPTLPTGQSGLHPHYTLPEGARAISHEEEITHTSPTLARSAAPPNILTGSHSRPGPRLLGR